jgi:transcriptional regulator with XRE-family HTH domain
MKNERLKNLRIKKGFTQIKIQLATGIDQSDYSKIETGLRYPTVEQAKRLAILLDTSTDYIFGLTDEEAPYPRK